MNQRIFLIVSLLFTLTLLVACGGSEPAPEEAQEAVEQAAEEVEEAAEEVVEESAEEAEPPDHRADQRRR